MSKWHKIKKLINKTPINNIITRQEIIIFVRENNKYISEHTIDSYRYMLTIVGVLKYIERGKYKVLHHIKKDITISKIKECSERNNWKSWFHDIFDLEDKNK